ncbi:MAG: histidine phosphatase family protein [Octadecabacter sp.]
MTRLILIRHAKSSWDDPFGDDHARTINTRGREAAAAIGKWLVANGYQPDLVLISDAVRAVETSELVLAALDPNTTTKYKPSLYHASPDTILDIVQREDAKCIAVIAHNPGIGMLAFGLAAQAPDHRRFDDYPTCATTVLDFSCAIDRELGHVVDFVVPRDLIGAAGRDAD